MPSGIYERTAKHNLARKGFKHSAETKLKMSLAYGTPETRFFNNLKRSITNSYNGIFCLEWTKYCTSAGYGQFEVNGQTVSVHRFAYKLHFGEIPEGLHCLHYCDNPPCCEPTHLFLGTHQDNMIDRDNKNRLNAPKGEKNGHAKLTEKQVLEIREKYIPRIYHTYILAEEYNVTQPIIFRIIKREIWKHI